MRVLVGRHETIKEYVESEEYKMTDALYCPKMTDFYLDYGQYIDNARNTRPLFIVTQSKEMLDVLLNSDLDFEVVRVVKKRGKVYARVTSKADAREYRELYNIELRY